MYFSLYLQIATQIQVSVKPVVDRWVDFCSCQNDSCVLPTKLINRWRYHYFSCSIRIMSNICCTVSFIDYFIYLQVLKNIFGIIIIVFKKKRKVKKQLMLERTTNMPVQQIKQHDFLLSKYTKKKLILYY